MKFVEQPIGQVQLMRRGDVVDYEALWSTTTQAAELGQLTMPVMSDAEVLTPARQFGGERHSFLSSPRHPVGVC
jgi:hypothetical protein